MTSRPHAAARGVSHPGRTMGAVETTSGPPARPRPRRGLTQPAFTGPNSAFAITPFMRLARTHAGSTASDAMVAAALAGTIFFEGATSDARGKVFLYLLLTMAPFAVVAPLIGPALDRARSGRRWIVIGSAALRALLCFAMIGRTDSLLLYPCAFGILVLQKAYGIARSSLVPSVVENDEELVEANSKLQLLSALMGFVGAAPAALLFAIFDSPAPVLALAVCGFAATAGLAVRIPAVAVAPASPTPEEKAELRSVGVLLAAAAMGLLRGIVGFLTLYFAFHFRAADELFAFGFVAAISVGGTLVGAALAPRLREVWPEERMLITVLVLTVAGGCIATVVGGVPGAALLGGAVGVASTGGKLAFDSIVQRDAPDANRGRLFARFETRFQIIWVVGSMLGLVPLSELRVSFVVVALVAGFAAFSYTVGLSAWRHRTGATDSEFGRQAVLIDQTMTGAKTVAKAKVRSGGRALVTRVRTRVRRADGSEVEVVSETPAPRPSAIPPAAHRPHVGPGIGIGMTPPHGTPAEPVDRHRFLPARRPILAKHADPTPPSPPPPPSPAVDADEVVWADDDPTEIAPSPPARRDAATFDPGEPPPPDDVPTTPWGTDPTHVRR